MDGIIAILRRFSLFVVLVISFSFLFYSYLFADDSEVIVKAIDIKGNVRIDRETILFNISLKEGMPFSIEKVREDVKKLFDTGFFETVDVDLEPFEGGVKLTYIVKEQPVVRKVSIEGNRAIKEADIRKELTQFKYNLYNEKVVSENVSKIKQLYQSKGYYNVKVDILTSKFENYVDLTYRITEGTKASVAKIEFVGNKAISSSELKEQMMTKEKTLFSTITVFVKQLMGKPATFYYIEDLLNADVMKIRQYYRDKGFMRAQVGDPIVDIKKDRIYIKIPIEEGERYKVAAIDVKVDKEDPYKIDELKSIIKLKVGDYYSAEIMRKDVEALTDAYGARGYVNADVRPLVDTNDIDHTVKVTYRIERGDKFYVGRIFISGNTKTRDKVIRREIPLSEGGEMNSVALKFAKRRLEGLGYFSNVNIENKPSETIKSEDKKYMDVFVKVEEQPTGSLMLGAGYSTTEQIGVMGSVSENNLFGLGIRTTLSMDISGKRRDYDINVFEPYLFDKPISLNTRLFNWRYEYDTYTEDSTGFSLVFGKRIINPYTILSLGYEFRRSELKDVLSDAPQFIIDAYREGGGTASSIIIGLTQDLRNSNLFPTEGFLRSITLKVAGLGGDYKYAKIFAEYSYYRPLESILKGGVLHLRGRLGILEDLGSGEKKPIFERFYVGSQDTVRGAKYEEATPREDHDAIGGTRELIFNAEYLFNLIGDLKALFFFDMGAAFDGSLNFGDLRKSAGLGLRYISPFGPIRIDYGCKLDSKPYDTSRCRFMFSFGTVF